MGSIWNLHKLNRRAFLNRLGKAAIAGSTITAAPAILAKGKNAEKKLNIHVTHTGENVKTTLWTPSDGYIADSVMQLSKALRDHRNDQYKFIHINTLDILAKLQALLSTSRATDIISGYRSPETNEMLRAQSVGVSKNSYHLKAMALDIRMSKVSVHDLGKAARALKAGGVGLYPSSNFVHIDSGPVRTWGS